ncbi:MAG: lytic transglycosylase domain-containing protein [Pyrinomonadaceae bacterium]|nr:lytic transglycosylase domain-containing protein [Pyrinomonadaceae bacterium]MDQ3135857.1 lytic transglycosylase domain-containing protein [Acidobacteriota bacterium]
MQISRLVPRFRSFSISIFSIFALFVAANLNDTFFVPIAIAKTTVKRVSSVYLPADLPTSGDARIDEIIVRASDRFGVDPRLLHHVIWQESKYQTATKSHAGAQGLMQLMPATAVRFDCRNASDPESNVAAGTRYLRLLLERFEGDVSLALAAYNAGEGNVDKYAGIPPFSETQHYVKSITGRYGSKYHPLLTPEEARINFGLGEEIAQAN